MDFDDFTKLLIEFNSNDSDKNQLHDLLMQFRDENYFQFIQFNLEIINDLTNSTLSSFVVLLIYNEVKSGKIFDDEEIGDSYIQSFLPMVPNIFQTELLLDNIKMHVSSIISFLAIKNYNESSDTSIQQFILQFFESNQVEFEPFVINSVMEIIIGCEGLGGFEDNIISEFLTMELQKESSFIPRCKLFFAVVLSSPDDENLSELFDTLYLQSPIPDIYIEDYLKVIIAFSEKNSEFFQPHLSTFIPELCEMAANPENLNRNMALFVFNAMATGAPIMCQTMSEFYDSVIECLLQVIAEIDEESPNENDTNSTESYVIARDVLQSIGSSSDDTVNYVKVIEKICDEAIMKASKSSQSTEDDIGQLMLQIPWQLSYAIASAYCKINIISASALYIKKIDYFNTDYDKIDELAYKFLPLLSSNETPPVLRIEILNLYLHLTRTFMYIFVKLTCEHVPPILFELIINDEDKDIKLLAAKALKTYFKVVLPDNLNEFFPDSYTEVRKILSQSPFYVYKKLIKSLTYFTAIGDRFAPYFQDYLNILITTYTHSNDDFDLKLSIINSIYFAFSKIKREDLTESLNQYLPFFLKDIILIGQENQIDEYSNEKYFKSITNLLDLLRESASEFALMLLPKALEKSNNDAQIDQIPKLDVIENPSLYEEIQETQPNYRNFALKSDIDEISKGLSMLAFIQVCLRLEIRPYIQDIIDTVQSWINNEYQIIKIKGKAWKNLETLAIIFKDEPEIENLMCIIFDNFYSTIETVPVILGEMMIITISYVLRKERAEWFDSDKISEALVKLEIFTDRVIEQLRSGIQTTDRYTGDHANKYESSIGHLLFIISQLYDIFLTKYTELTITYMEENNFIEKMTELLNSSEISEESNLPFITFAYEIITPYICKTGNMDDAIDWVQNLFEIAEKCEGDASCLAFKFMLHIFLVFDFPTEFAIALDERFGDFLSKVNDAIDNDEENEDVSLYSDWGLPAYAVFIEMNKDKIDFDNAASVWCDVFPIWSENEISDYGYHFLIELCNERNSAAFSEDNLERILNNVISKINDMDLMKKETIENAKEAMIRMVKDTAIGSKVLCYIEDDFYDKKELFWKNKFAEELFLIGKGFFGKE